MLRRLSIFRDIAEQFAAPTDASTLIPVLVTGIQPTRVCAARESFQPEDLG